MFELNLIIIKIAILGYGLVPLRDNVFYITEFISLLWTRANSVFVGQFFAVRQTKLQVFLRLYRCSLSGRILVWGMVIDSQSNHCPCNSKIASALAIASISHWLLTGTHVHVVWERKSDAAGQAMLFIKQLLSVQKLFCFNGKAFLEEYITSKHFILKVSDQSVPGVIIWK